ncbi:MAG: helix-turn-helix transcriptional regulator [Ferruginibacter sp.]
MFNFTYQYCNHTDYLHHLADAAGVPVIDNAISLPPEIGTGYIKAIELANGLQVLINECVTDQDVSFKREAALDESYTLRFDAVKNVKALTLQIDNDTLNDEDLIYSGAFLTNSLFGFEYTATAGAEDRCINIYFTAEWLKNNVGIQSSDEAFKEYLSLKTATLNFEILNLEYRTLMEEIFEINEQLPMYKVVIQNRVMLLIEKFFRSILSKISKKKKPVNINDTSIKRVMLVESILVSNLSAPPPTIPVLARKAMMSETKLKNLFKQVYGLSLYEYYQKNRMLRARQLLRTKNYSVKETGTALGFKNLSNFTIAYKKEFNILPSEM